jgi:hypothetical protein
MNNTRADMYHNLVCEHRKLSDAHSKLQLELSQKGKLNRHIHICWMPCLLFSTHILPVYIKYADNLTFCRHSAAGAEAQVTELVKRVKELTGMPDSGDLLPYHLHFKSFNSCPYSLVLTFS